MSRPLRSLKDGRIAIVCEGSETEAPFLREVRSLLEKSGKVPIGSIVIFPKIESSEANPEATLQTQKTGNASQWHYYYTAESNQQDYDQYKAQPTRYVREAQLLMEQEGYYCAWAVFDNDNFAHLKDAFDLAEQQRQQGKKLFVAYSSISIEESLLLSKERCGKNFESSADVIDYMKDKRYIDDSYHKSNAWSVFGSQMIDKGSGKPQNGMLFNSTWSQQLERSKPLYERNPYSNFEKLLQFLSKDDRELRWVHSGEEFLLDQNVIKIEKKGTTYILTNVSGSRIVLNDKNYGFTEENLSIIPALKASVILNIGENIVINKHTKRNLCLSFGNKIYIAY